MPYCNACGKYIREGLLCPYCARVSPDDDRYPVPDPDEEAAAPEAGEATDADGTPPVGEEPEKSGVSDPIAPRYFAECDEETAAPPEAEESAEADTPAGSSAYAPGEEATSGARTADGGTEDAAPGLNATLRRAYARILDTEDTTDRFSPRDVRAHRTMAALSYLGILWAIPFFFARSSRFVRFHLGQGLLLLLADGIAATLLGLTLLTGSLAPAICPALAAATEVIVFLSLILKVCGVTYAMRGRARELPLIGSCADAA